MNGKAVDGVTAGEYATVAGSWKVGDEIVVTIPLQLRTESTDDRKDIQALFYGPTVLNALNPSTKFIQRGFYERNGLDGTIKLGVQKNILYVQGGAVTVLSLLFVVMPSVQSFYQILSQLTVVLYLIMYMLMFSGAIVLRYKMKKLNRPFRIGKNGNGLMWLIGGLGFCGSLLAFVLSFIPPSQISTGSNTVWFSVLIIGALIVVIAPFIIYASKKPSWVDPNSSFEPFHWEEQPAVQTAGKSATNMATGSATASSNGTSNSATSGNTAKDTTNIPKG